MTSFLKLALIFLLSLLFFTVEFLLFNLFGPWAVPNLLLILVVFFDFYLGIRYGLFTAAVCGLIKDSFNIDIFGGYFLSFVACAYTATLLRKYVYHSGVTMRRILTVSSVLVINFIILFCLQIFKGPVSLGEAVWHVLIPEVILTLIATNSVFTYLRRCASKLSV